MGWISVNDKIPKSGEIVFLCFQRDGICHIEKGYYIPECGFEAFDLLMQSEDYQDLITHWMPIPKPPETA